jgi:hypothetical protein
MDVPVMAGSVLVVAVLPNGPGGQTQAGLLGVCGIEFEDAADVAL